MDDSGNLETPQNGVTVNVPEQVCPCSIWNVSNAPTLVDSGDPGSVELGLKFQADTKGSIVGIRFYKASTNTGTHVGNLWSTTGVLLGSATFSGESGSGWQQVNFASPIPVIANKTYIISYLAPAGHYSADRYFFEPSGVDNPPLHALQSILSDPNGVFFYGPSGGFPTFTYRSTNYWVDVVYSSTYKKSQ